MAEKSPSRGKTDAITKSQFKKGVGGPRGRLCGDLTKLEKHLLSVQTGIKHPKACHFCGEQCYTMCQICNAPLHFIPSRGASAGNTCFFDYHNSSLFGIGKEDCKLTQKRKSEWTFPSPSRKRENAKKTNIPVSGRLPS